MLLLIGAVFVGALAVFAVPTTVLHSGSSSLHAVVSESGLNRFTLADLNPLRAIFDYEQQRINDGTTPEQLGFHGTAVTLGPIWTPPPTLGLSIDKDSMDRAFAARVQSQIQQSYQHSQDLQAYGRDPAHWIGPPPQ